MQASLWQSSCAPIKNAHCTGLASDPNALHLVVMACCCFADPTDKHAKCTPTEYWKGPLAGRVFVGQLPVHQQQLAYALLDPFAVSAWSPQLMATLEADFQQLRPK